MLVRSDMAEKGATVSGVPENFSDTTEFDAELTLIRLRGMLELAVERFSQLGDRIKTLKEAIEKLQTELPDHDE
jgi:hypothetical protein